MSQLRNKIRKQRRSTKFPDAEEVRSEDGPLDAQSARGKSDPPGSQSDEPNRPVASWQVEPQGVAHPPCSPGGRPKRFAFLEHLRVLEVSRQVIDRVG